MIARPDAIHSLFRRTAQGRVAPCLYPPLAVFLALVSGVCAHDDTERQPAPTPISRPAPVFSTPLHYVEIGEGTFPVEVADSPYERSEGLSYRESLADGTGMLFVFRNAHVPSFWMREMRFPLDFVWIGEDCTVVDITRDVPNPPLETPESDLPRYSPSEPALYNLEINAGEAARRGIGIGDGVRFRDVPGGGC